MRENCDSFMLIAISHWINMPLWQTLSFCTAENQTDGCWFYGHAHMFQVIRHTLSLPIHAFAHLPCLSLSLFLQHWHCSVRHSTRSMQHAQLFNEWMNQCCSLCCWFIIQWTFCFDTFSMYIRACIHFCSGCMTFNIQDLRNRMKGGYSDDELLAKMYGRINWFEQLMDFIIRWALLVKKQTKAEWTYSVWTSFIWKF